MKNKCSLTSGQPYDIFVKGTPRDLQSIHTSKHKRTTYVYTQGLKHLPHVT